MAVIEAEKAAELDERKTAPPSISPNDASRDGTDALSAEMHELLCARRAAVTRASKRNGLHLSINLPT